MSYRDLFRTLNANDIEYVVPRRYDNLPDETISEDGDVDIITGPNQFQTILEICESIGFVTRNNGLSRLQIAGKALSKPQKAFRTLLREPSKPLKRMTIGVGIPSDEPRHRNEVLHRNDQLLDLQENLAYESPMDGSKIPVDPSVTEGMLGRRREKNCFYVPAPADELAHIIPHCVFDKQGEFPAYYADRCDELFDSVQADDDQLRLFEELLDTIFFKAGNLVFDHIRESRYSAIRTELKQFSDY